MDRDTVLKTANNLINGPRKDDYGDLRTNFQTLADLWSVWLSARFGVRLHLKPEDVAIMNMQVKQARLANNLSYADGWVDIAGYAALGAEVNGERVENIGEQS